MRTLLAKPLCTAVGIVAVSIFALPAALPQPSSASLPIGGTLACARPVFHESMAVGDRTGHNMELTQRHCTWPGMIQDTTVKDDLLSVLTDTREDHTSDSGYNVLFMSGGDRIFMRYSRLVKTDHGSAQVEGVFVISGGTGKFAGITGNGKFTSFSMPDGSLTIQANGQYKPARAQ